MRMSCNGCRVLRKGCSEDCSIRPCLQWIKNPESQANATVFLAKFYGRAGLMNLINSGPDHLRPGLYFIRNFHFCRKLIGSLLLDVRNAEYLMFSIGYSDIQISSLRGLWKDRKSDLRFRRTTLVRQLAALSNRCGICFKRRTDHSNRV